MTKFKPGMRVKVLPAIAKEFNQLVAADEDTGIVEAERWVSGIQILIVQFDATGTMKKLPSNFVVPLVADPYHR
jgi:hypothetical protein